MTTMNTTISESYRAALNKLETIKAFVEGIDYDYNALEEIRDAEESLKQAQKDLEDELLEKKNVLSQLELAEEASADIGGTFKKYQDAVDAGYDDNVTLELRDKYKSELEEVDENRKELQDELQEVEGVIADLQTSVAEWKAKVKELEEDFEPHPHDIDTPEDNHSQAQASVLLVEYRSGWSIKEDSEVAEVRLTLAIGGPSIYLYADYDDGQVSNCKLVCNWWGDRAEITHDQDVMVRFIEYVNA